MGAGVMAGLLAGGAAPAAPAEPDAPGRSYYVYVAAESDDEVAIVRYGPAGAEVVKTVVVGSYPAEVEGPHGSTSTRTGATGTSRSPTDFRTAAFTSTRPAPMPGSATSPSACFPQPSTCRRPPGFSSP